MTNILTVTHTDGPAFNTRSQAQQDSTATNSTTPPDITPDISSDTSPIPKSLTADRLEALLQMQKPIHSANTYLSICSMEKHHNIKLISSLTSEDCYINM